MQQKPLTFSGFCRIVHRGYSQSVALVVAYIFILNASGYFQ